MQVIQSIRNTEALSDASAGHLQRLIHHDQEVARGALLASGAARTQREPSAGANIAFNTRMHGLRAATTLRDVAGVRMWQACVQLGQTWSVPRAPQRRCGGSLAALRHTSQRAPRRQTRTATEKQRAASPLCELDWITAACCCESRCFPASMWLHRHSTIAITLRL